MRDANEIVRQALLPLRGPQVNPAIPYAPRTSGQALGVLGALPGLWQKQWRAAASPLPWIDALGGSEDPTVRSVVDIAAAFTPGGGGRGGKFTNLTDADKRLLTSLGNVRREQEGPDYWRGMTKPPFEHDPTTPLSTGGDQAILDRMGANYSKDPIHWVREQMDTKDLNSMSELGLVTGKAFPFSHNTRTWISKAENVTKPTLNPLALADRVDRMIPGLHEGLRRSIVEALANANYAYPIAMLRSELNSGRAEQIRPQLQEALDLVNVQAERQANLLTLWNQLGRANQRGETPEVN